MSRIRNMTGNGREHPRRGFYFTAILLPVTDELLSPGKSKARKSGPATPPGYKVPVPLLPGVFTFGRAEEEAIEMAREAIRCHLDGLRESGEDIPDEKRTHTAKLRVALSA